MTLTLEATFDGEVFRPDEPVDLEPNTRVKLNLVVKKKKKTDKPYSFLDYALSIDLDAPPDYASNIDEYLYGGKSLDNE
ncbi:MAG TPA: antitoxin AF2212-like protein [Pyrinomonadaceae bacterium]|nr:antitoxin AF2212-like protein [Pyrinomonadaceae bacterium]